MDNLNGWSIGKPPRVPANESPFNSSFIILFQKAVELQKPVIRSFVDDIAVIIKGLK